MCSAFFVKCNVMYANKYKLPALFRVGFISNLNVRISYPGNKPYANHTQYLVVLTFMSNKENRYSKHFGLVCRLSNLSVEQWVQLLQANMFSWNKNAYQHCLAPHLILFAFKSGKFTPARPTESEPGEGEGSRWNIWGQFGEGYEPKSA